LFPLQEVFWIPLCTDPPHIFCLPTSVIACVLYTEKSLKLTFIHQDSRLDIFYSVNLCRTSSIILVSGIFHFTQVPHTYQVSQPLSSHVSGSRNRHRKIAEIDVSRHGFEISLLLSCELVLRCLNRSCIVDSTFHTHPTHVLSPNHYHRMCLGQGTDINKSLKLTFVHQDTSCHFFCPVNLCQTT